MVRISKERYQRMQQMKLDMAKSHASSFYKDAQKAVENSDVFSALNYLSEAVKSIADYLDKDLTHHSVNGSVNLGTEIYGLIQDIYHRIELTPVQKIYSVNISKHKQVPIEVTAKFYTNSGETVSLSGLPLNFTFSKGEGVLSSRSATNHDGVAKVVISRLISKSKTQEIRCSLDISTDREITPDVEASKVLDMFFPEKMIPTTYIALELQKSKAFLQMEEIVFDKYSKQEPFLNSVKTILNKSVFTFTNNREDADFIVKLKSKFIAGEEKKGNGYSLFIVFADFNLSLVNAKTNEEVFSDGFNGVRGMRPGSYEYALKDARKNALEKFREKILTRMEQLNM
jgi:ribosomal protein S20